MKRVKTITTVLAVLVALMLGASTGNAVASTPQGAKSQSAPISPASASGRCAGGHLCVFVDSNFGGSYNQFNTGCVDITEFSTANKVSSIDFPGPGSYQAWFYDNGHFVLSLLQGHYLKNLASDTSASGGNANDKIDEVVIC